MKFIRDQKLFIDMLNKHIYLRNDWNMDWLLRTLLKKKSGVNWPHSFIFNLSEILGLVIDRAFLSSWSFILLWSLYNSLPALRRKNLAHGYLICPMVTTKRRISGIHDIVAWLRFPKICSNLSLPSVGYRVPRKASQIASQNQKHGCGRKHEILIQQRNSQSRIHS